MGLPDIALIGHARSGKDALAAELRRSHAYTRVAFADPLKAMLLRIDPIIGDALDITQEYLHLAEYVSAYGWEEAKNGYPEVRRVLQSAGQAQRETDEFYWIKRAVEKIEAARRWSLPMVVTDCRYRAEADVLSALDFTMVRVVRPASGLVGALARHASETELDDYVEDITLENNGSLEDWQATARELVERLRS